ncbi:MAG: DNA phosphorothioation-dependent restriction protein DptG [Lachnospiraceae bacterium]|nr:DNA phosphorothioation-dependent restriction protein DptG [Lachnospiraceae bacterium]
MEYQLSEDKFCENYIDSAGKFRHKVGSKIKLFPFITTPGTEPIMSLERLAGRIISIIEGAQMDHISANDVITELISKTNIQVGQEDVFRRLLTNVFFDKEGKIKPLNLKLLEVAIDLEATEKKHAEYIASVLGNKAVLKDAIEKAHAECMKNSNVLENMVVSCVAKDTHVLECDDYFCVSTGLIGKFNEDFQFVLENATRTKEHLVQLLEFYYFMYTVQSAMNLDRFFAGDRSEIIPLYFSLDWEQTSLSRKCYSEGWQKVQSSLNRIFAHVVTLDFLNLTDDGFPQVDYIMLRELVDGDPEVEKKMAIEVRHITDMYRANINDCSEMKGLERDETKQDRLDAEVRFLFNSVKTQFEFVRNRPYTAYSRKFVAYCNKYLKNRRRSGMMLTLTEDMVLFLTKICIKEKDRIRLKEVFDEFAARGVFLDDTSKDKVTEYYEKLNLIEKKSDSGDAKYVKRIL